MAKNSNTKKQKVASLRATSFPNPASKGCNKFNLVAPAGKCRKCSLHPAIRAICHSFKQS